MSSCDIAAHQILPHILVRLAIVQGVDVEYRRCWNLCMVLRGE